MNSVVKRFMMALVVAVGVVGPVIVWMMAGGQQRFGELPDPAPPAVTAAVAEFSKTLKVQEPVVINTTMSTAAAAFCMDGNCVIQLGKDMRKDAWQKNPDAVRATIAHEMGHVLQAAQGQFTDEYVELVWRGFLYGAVIVALVVAGSGVIWWCSSFVMLSALCWAAIEGGVITLDDLTFITLCLALVLSALVAVAGYVFFLAGRKTDASYAHLSSAAARVLCYAIVAVVGWSSLRGLGSDTQKNLETAADMTSACLVGVKDALGFLELQKQTLEGKNIRADIYHPTGTARIESIKALQGPRLLDACRQIHGL